MFRRIREWILLLIWYMVIAPIGWVIQGILTPFELVYQLIRHKGNFRPKDYAIIFNQNNIEIYKKLLRVYGIYDYDDFVNYVCERFWD